MQAAVRPAGGSFSAPVDVSAAGLQAAPAARRDRRRRQRDRRLDADGRRRLAGAGRDAAGRRRVLGARRPVGDRPGQRRAGRDERRRRDRRRLDARRRRDNRIVQAATRPPGGAFCGAGRPVRRRARRDRPAGRDRRRRQRPRGLVALRRRDPRRADGHAPGGRSLRGAGRPLGRRRRGARPAASPSTRRRHRRRVAALGRREHDRPGRGAPRRRGLRRDRRPVGPGRDAVAPQVGIDADGDAIAAGSAPTARTRSSRRPATTAPDPAARVERAATATAGTAASYSVSPLDVWSPVGSTQWTFDDGDERGGRERLARLRLGGRPHRHRDRDGRARQPDERDARRVRRRAACQPTAAAVPPPPPPPPAACTRTAPSKLPRLAVAIGFDAHVTKRYTVFTKLVVQPAVAGRRSTCAARSRLPVQDQDAQPSPRARAGLDLTTLVRRREAAPRRADRGPGDKGRHRRCVRDDRRPRSQAPAAGRALPVPGRSHPGALP